MQNRKKTAMFIAVAFFILAVLAAVVCLKGKDALPAAAGAEADDGKMPAYERLLNLLSGKEDGAEEGVRGAAGTYAGNEYKNERFGISVVFDDGWYFFDSETREAITANTYGMAGKEDIGESIYDLYAGKKEEGKSISMVIDDCRLIFGKELSEEEYLKETEKALASKDMKEMGYSDMSISCGTSDMAGKSHACMDAESTIEGRKICQKFIAIKDKELMMLITMTAPEKKDIEDMKALFR